MTIPLTEVLDEACAPKKEPLVINMSDLTHLDGTPLTDEEQAQVMDDVFSTDDWAQFCEEVQSGDDGHTLSEKWDEMMER